MKQQQVHIDDKENLVSYLSKNPLESKGNRLEKLALAAEQAQTTLQVLEKFFPETETSGVHPYFGIITPVIDVPGYFDGMPSLEEELASDKVELQQSSEQISSYVGKLKITLEKGRGFLLDFRDAIEGTLENINDPRGSEGSFAINVMGGFPFVVKAEEQIYKANLVKDAALELLEDKLTEGGYSTLHSGVGQR